MANEACRLEFNGLRRCVVNEKVACPTRCASVVAKDEYAPGRGLPRESTTSTITLDKLAPRP